jgi:hypothetical protein
MSDEPTSTPPPGSTPPPHPGSPPAPEQRRSFGERFVAALKLETALYKEVEHDPSALPQAAGVVVIAAIASGVGVLGMLGPRALLTGLVSAFVSWVVWTTVVWLIGVKLFDHTSDFEELLRTLGFVAAPQALYILMLVPFDLFRAIVGGVVVAMTLLGFVRATREALDVETGRALLVAVLGILTHLILNAALGTVVGFD